MGSRTMDLERAVLHKTIKSPQQHFHTESRLEAMAKPGLGLGGLGARTDGSGAPKCSFLGADASREKKEEPEEEPEPAALPSRR